MNENQAELASALLDGELDDLSQERAVDELLRGPAELRDRYARYRLIGDVLRGESALGAEVVATRVEAALRDEPVVLAPRRRSPQWLKPAMGAALAASVAAVAIVVTPTMLSSGEDSSAPTVVQLPPRPQLAPALVSTAPTAQRQPVQGAAEEPSRVVAQDRWQAVDPGLQERLNRLVIEHHEFSGRTGLNGPVSHIGLVRYDGR
jgi:sigma-E factor negative regulatory protein RseA